MPFNTTLGITTIDNPDTKRREDGFMVDLKSRTINLVSVVPNFELASLQLVEKSLASQSLDGKDGKFFFPKGEGLSTAKVRKVLIVSFPPPYDQANVGIGKAIIIQRLTYNEANYFLETDPTLKAVSAFTSMELQSPFLSNDLIHHLGYKFNTACAEAMKNNNIPYLGRDKQRASTRTGFCVTSKPLRDAVAFINCFQLSTFLETGEKHFSRKHLRRLTQKSPVA